MVHAAKAVVEAKAKALEVKEVADPSMEVFHEVKAQRNSHPCAKSILEAAIDFYRLCRWSLTDLNSPGRSRV